MISLKLDIATRMDKSVLGINVQYIEDYKIMINTIGMIQLNKQHTAAYIKDEVMKCLKSYDIDISQIYSNTTDNGANVVKASKMLQEEQAEELCEDQNETANDVIKTIDQITECREVVKTLRRLVRSSEHNVKMPVLDNATRWNSTFNMMQSLLSVRSQIEAGFLQALPSSSKDGDTNLNWDFIIDFVAAFQPLAKCTVQLQTEQYILGDFYRDWLNCEIELEDIGEQNKFAGDLLSAMKTRKVRLLENDAVIAALYLDPRFNYQNSTFLSEVDKSKAMAHLIKTYELIKKLKGTDEYIQNEHRSISANSPSLETPSTSSFYSKLEERISLLDNSSPQQTISIKQKLTDLGNKKRVPFETDVLKYWKNINFDEDISSIVKVVLAVPATQVSVERAFSALSLILTKWRSKLSSSTINNLLLTKLNYKEIMPSSIDLSECSNLNA
ncbi:hypothetical protein EVAR_68583_1 [Eumeta japonica]|uniref:HAT C-terminal dimerisation domain-containing protein n=1 Tax=Eumeta variegata TaxID=151549 RepID=A0A4C1SHD7_EUMVA|nr:hypothetical protein EVAR_68583_1 [Eumeta japonica]